jgi:polyisoprenoid-binding protein YceI
MDRIRTLGLVAGLFAAAAAFAQQPADGTYQIDESRSSVYWQVYKAGAFARFGHNHVISAANYDGTVTLAADPSGSSFALTIPVADLVVDDPQLRAQKGEDFSSVPSEDDIAGTRRNMLSERVLNRDVFPELEISGSNLSAVAEDASIDVSIGILGRQVDVTLPVSVRIDGRTLVASGNFTLTHEDLGMKPFSVMAGALQVGPQIDFFYRIVARKSD